MQEKLTGILSKAVKSRKKEIIVAENVFGNTLFIPVLVIEKLYTTSYELSMFNFQKKHNETLKISAGELERIEKNLVATMNVDTKADPKETIEQLIAESLMTSFDVILKYGEQTEVIAQPQLAAVKVIILYYPEYLIVKNNYLPIRGGNKLFEEVTLRTKEEFEGVVPGRWKWNLGNWVSRHGSVSKHSAKVPSSNLVAQTKAMEKEFVPPFPENVPSDQREEVAINDEASTVNIHDDYFNQ